MRFLVIVAAALAALVPGGCKLAGERPEEEVGSRRASPSEAAAEEANPPWWRRAALIAGTIRDRVAGTPDSVEDSLARVADSPWLDCVTYPLGIAFVVLGHAAMALHSP
jgi:hypothetical protein